MTTLPDLKARAREHLKELIQSTGAYNEDLLIEVADASVPIYNSDILEVAMDDLTLATTECEIGPAFDGTATAVNIIASNIYESVFEYLSESAEEIIDELDLGDEEDEEDSDD